jgi:hypothetical protein
LFLSVRKIKILSRPELLNAGPSNLEVIFGSKRFLALLRLKSLQIFERELLPEFGVPDLNDNNKSCGTFSLSLMMTCTSCENADDRPEAINMRSVKTLIKLIWIKMI